MKKLLFTILCVTQLSAFSMEAFVKTTASEVHAGNAETVAIMSGGDYFLEVNHEDAFTGHGCVFAGKKVRENTYQDSEVSSCKIKIEQAIDGSYSLSQAKNANCVELCGVAGELEVDGLIYQERE